MIDDGEAIIVIREDDEDDDERDEFDNVHKRQHAEETDELGWHMIFLGSQKYTPGDDDDETTEI